MSLEELQELANLPASMYPITYERAFRRVLNRMMELEANSKPVAVQTDLPDDDITVLAFSDLDGWTVAHLSDGDWIEEATGDRITVLKWMHLPGDE